MYNLFSVLGKTFLNTIEYLDEKTNEWTTFVPKSNYDFHSRRKSRNRRNSRKSTSEDNNRIQNVEQEMESTEGSPNGVL